MPIKHWPFFFLNQFEIRGVGAFLLEASRGSNRPGAIYYPIYPNLTWPKQKTNSDFHFLNKGWGVRVLRSTTLFEPPSYVWGRVDIPVPHAPVRIHVGNRLILLNNLNLCFKFRKFDLVIHTHTHTHTHRNIHTDRHTHNVQ